MDYDAILAAQEAVEEHRRRVMSKWGSPQQVLDDGHVRLVDFMGDDAAIPQAARVSYGAGTKTLREDAELIRFLMRHEHFSPFAMCQVKLHLRLPIFVHNQFIRHDRFHWNVMSARYSEMPNEKWRPSESAELRGQGQGNKQVGNGDLDPMRQGVLHQGIIEFNDAAQAKYKELLELGLCREQARTVLPMGQYTEAYVTANLGDWLLFLKQRLSPHAQKEIRDFAEVIYSLLSDLFPVTMQAFMDYQLNSVRFSAQEIELLRNILQQEIKVESGSEVVLLGDIPPKRWAQEIRKAVLSRFLPTKRERQEFWRKISD